LRLEIANEGNAAAFPGLLFTKGTMTAATYIAIYAGLVLFLAGCLWRVWVYARTPLHLRWELYPLPHEHPYRAAYGGSYFETQEWWRKPQIKNRRGEFLVMIEEILFLKSLREFNRKLWVPSFLFHSGLYLVICAVGLTAVAALAGVLAEKGSAVVASELGSVVVVVGIAGAVLIVTGACLLLIRRSSDPAFKNSTKAADIFNLLFFIAAFSLVASGYLTRAAGAASVSEFAHGVVHFDRGVKIGTVFGAGLILASALASYIPFTHMAHFIAKYFTWHAVRWDDRHNEPGQPMDTGMATNLAYKPTWSAGHIGADGKRSWAEIAASAPPEIKK
jgi:nitrate reductase gamma subunit